ncbi:hypothetical protein [Rhodanobacter sp. A1T4]|uniref:hypothetical protein n=1 Tax=Rhodanobacter sp. A1T4 TaxID=2723087 RepID=UPI00161B6DFE|nr:hypothetical protein [Rhodanobacter sp. A1T4]MBB6245081.1 hypothetical protein [Rhodanobacter sp. A1T4]
MKTLGLAIALIFISMNAVYAQQATPARAPLAPGQLDAVFLYGRAQAFHDIVQAQHCDQIDAQTVNTINQRLENARSQLEARFGAKAVPAGGQVPPQIAEHSCDAMTIDSYSNHMRELEQHLSRLGANS